MFVFFGLRRNRKVQKKTCVTLLRDKRGGWSRPIVDDMNLLKRKSSVERYRKTFKLKVNIYG